VNDLPESRIERELNKLIPVAVPYNLRRHFPFKQLGQRRLELLLFALFRRGLESGAYKKEFDDLALTPSFEGLGRIVLLRYRKQTTGAVLCCQTAEPLNTGDFVRLLLLFAEVAERESLLKLNQSPRIFLALPGGVDTEVQMLTQDWPAGLIHLEGLPAADPDHLKALNVEWLLPADLDPLLAAEPDLKSLFFAVEMVAPEQSLRRILGEFRVEELEEQEAAAVVAKLTATPGSSMNSVGLIRFFGYPREFLRQLVKDPALREIMIKGAEFKAELDYAVLDFLHLKCQLIGKVLLATAPVPPHAPARQAVVPFVFSRIVIKYLKNSNSVVLQEIARSGARRDFYEDANLDMIRADLLTLAVELAEQELWQEPFANPVDSARMEALRHAALETPNQAQLAQRFADDWEALQPVIRSMEKKMLAFLPRDPVLLLDDFGSLKDEKGKASQLLAGFRKRFQKPDP